MAAFHVVHTGVPKRREDLRGMWTWEIGGDGGGYMSNSTIVL